MSPKRKVPANLAAARAKRHPTAAPPAVLEEPAAQENRPVQSATTALVTAPPDPPRHRKPSGRAPTIGLDGPEAEWDYGDGCWRTPGGSVHEVLQHKKLKLSAEAERALCVDIDREVAGEPPHERKSAACALSLTVPASCRHLLKAPAVPCLGGRVTGAREAAWYAEVRAALTTAVHRSEVLPKGAWTPSGEIHVLRPAVREQQPGGGWRMKSTYWPAVEARLASAGVSRAQYEVHLRAEFAAQLQAAEVKLQARRAVVCEEAEAEWRERGEAWAATWKKAALERQARREADPDYTMLAERVAGLGL